MSLVILITTSIYLFSQNQWSGNMKSDMKGMAERMKIGHFYGKIVDSTSGKGVEFAPVQLLGDVFDTITKQMKHNVVINGQLTKENGDFSLEKINITGKYKLKIASMGYATKEIPVSFDFDPEKMKNGGGMNMAGGFDKDLGNIKLKISATELKGVTIVAPSAPEIELKLDKKVFNVEKSAIATGGTAEDVLKQVPSVSVDMDGNVSLRNAAPQIFVDGKATTLTIDQIPADAIQSVEVITNPSAKYDASGGMGGILNIVLKKDKRVGYNGNVRAGVDRYGKIHIGADINARENKINVFLSGNLNQRHSLSNGYTERHNLIQEPLMNIFQNQNSTVNGSFKMLRGGFDWFANNRNTFTFSGMYMNGMFNPTDGLHVENDTLRNSNINTTTYNRTSHTNRNFQNTGGTFQFKHLFPKEGQEWTADLNYNSSLFKSSGDYLTQYLYLNSPLRPDVVQNMNSNGNSDIISSQTDFVLPMKGKSKIETGLKGTYRSFLSKNQNFMKNDSTGDFYLIKNQSTNYRFIDQVYAGYITFSSQINKFSYQLGLRTESSFYTGVLIDSNKTFKNYFPASFFPSGFLTYKLNDKDNLQVSYSRRINRPSFFQLIPFTDYSDSLNLRKGNPGLKPEFVNSIELSYMKVFNQSNNILLTGYFKNSNNLITNYQSIQYDSVMYKPVIMSSYENANASYVYGGEFTSKNTIKKWLDITFNVNLFYSIIDATNIETTLSNERMSWYTRNNITIKLPKNFSIQLSPEYRSKASVTVNNGNSGQSWMGITPANVQGYIKERYSVDGAIKYEFLKNKAASLTLNIRDIFSTDKYITVSNSTYFDQTSSRLRDPHYIRLNFSYRFGKFDTSLFKRKNMKMNSDGMDMGGGM